MEKGFMKIVINKSYSSYTIHLSEQAIARLIEWKVPSVSWEWQGRPRHWEHEPGKFTGRIDDKHVPRDHPALVKLVEEMGDAVNGNVWTELGVVEVPAGVQWEILIVRRPDAIGGSMEQVHEIHRVWQ